MHYSLQLIMLVTVAMSQIETFILHLGVCSNILFKNIMSKVKDKINVLFCLILFTFLIKLIF